MGESKVLVHNCEVGFYHVTGKDGNVSYIGKGPDTRAKVSKKNNDGESVTHFAVKEGIGGFNKDQVSLIFEHLSIKGKGIDNLNNKINSPGRNLYDNIKDPKVKKAIDVAYKKAIKSKGNKL
ncbi:hypothetical protein [Flavobacterium branchiophilum]|uniref:GIY-YIG domain-containing protein n=1 Tax=Flavobacterium branchiophilum TaxID=55197 RepID=A0A2H3KUE8_9FLAO|nr:hypothetical protein [Flavobacterium branchiophilum]PDS21947.1 hypothetical protein B0A77_14690 [Flavobacterium branchiophilum]